MPASADPRGRTIRSRSWRLYRLQLALGAAGLGACVLAVATGVRAVHVRPDAAHRLDVGGVGLSYPTINVAAAVVLGLAVLGAAVIAVTATAVWGQLRAHRRLVRALPIRGPLAAHPSVLVVDAAAPLAFCAGWLRPRVYISTGVLRRLSEPELRAVLAHEQHHGALRDPLRLAVGRVLSQALFFLPVVRALHDRYADAAELRADAAALQAVDGAPGPLASALLVFGRGASGEVTGISPQRVDALLGLPVAVRLPRTLLVGGLLTIAVLVALAWRAGGSASVQATLNLPIATSQPCVLVLALVPVLTCVAAAMLRRPARG